MECCCLLSSEERKRAFEFAFSRRRKQYIMSRYSMRTILSFYLNVHPKEIAFTYNDYGKPSINATDFEFNLTYRNEHALLAVTHHSPVGIDMEQMSHDLDLEPMARMIFSPQEYRDFLSLDDISKHRALYHAWTCKEAFTKCLGWGLSFDLKCCQVHLQAPPELLSISHPQFKAQDYQLYEVQTDLPDSIAVAVTQGDPKQLRYFDFQAGLIYEPIQLNILTTYK